MASGRGQFFRSLREGLERQRARPGSGGGRAAPGWRRSFGEERRDAQEESEQRNAASGDDNLVERLPCEVLRKILSHLDPASLFCLGHVSQLFRHLANDDVIWEKVYMSEFGRQTWKPKLDEAAQKPVPAEDGHRPTGRWKQMYLRAVVGQEVATWGRELRASSPHTGLPRQTEWVLRKQKVSWELDVWDRCGRRSTLEQSGAYFLRSSVIVCWTGGGLLDYRGISSLQLYGVRKEALRSPRRPDWRCLMAKLDVAQRGRLLGNDRLISLMHLQPGFIIAVWRGQSSVAFIMASLHFHKLVERSLLGSPVCPYSGPVDRPPGDRSHPELGLHGYTLHFVLHNTGTEIMSGHFCDVCSHTAQVQRRLVELRIIDRADLSQHRALSGTVTLPWRSEGLQGSVQNCCVMSLTLLDDFQKPVWCVSSPVCITAARKPLSSGYRGRRYLMTHHHPDGRVNMDLVWLKEQKQFFLTSLTLYVSVSKLQRHFSGTRRR